LWEIVTDFGFDGLFWFRLVFSVRLLGSSTKVTCALDKKGAMLQ